MLYRKLHEQEASKFHVQLCISLFCMLIVFVSGIDQTRVYEGCVTVSVLVHYFTLVMWMWMGAEAVHMYKKLVIVFGAHLTTKYIIGVSLVCWCKFPNINLTCILQLLNATISHAVNTDFCDSLYCSGTSCSSGHSTGN